MAGLLLIVYHIFLAPHGLMVHASTDPLALFFVIGTTLFNLSAVAVVSNIMSLYFRSFSGGRPPPCFSSTNSYKIILYYSTKVFDESVRLWQRPKRIK